MNSLQLAFGKHGKQKLSFLINNMKQKDLKILLQDGGVVYCLAREHSPEASTVYT